jgi:predicted amidohydrolase YtcJ
MAPIRTLHRREVLKFGTALAAGCVQQLVGAPLGAAQGPASIATTTVQPRDLVLGNGRFMDGRGPVTSALFIRNGRIASLDAQAAPPPDATVVDLLGRTVVPGLFDSHVHYARAGVNPGYEARGIERAFSIRELQETIARGASAAPPSAFITCIGGWNHLQFAERRRPTKDELDAAAPNHPVYIAATGGDTGAITNSRGQTFFASQGVAVDAVTGRVTAANAALAALQKGQSIEDKRASTARLNGYASRLGLTAVKNSGNLDDLELALELWRRGRLSVRMRPTFPADSPEDVDARVRNNFSQQGRAVGDDMFRVVGFGERVGGMNTTSEGFEPTARAVAKGRWPLEQHSLTAEENAFHLAALQAIAREHPLRDLRWTLIHANAVSEPTLKALSDLGVGILPHGAARYLGTAKNAGPPYRRILDSGLIAGAGSDATNVAPLDPWLGLFYMITGRNLAGDLINDGQQVTRTEAIRMYTSGTAYYTFDEQVLGAFDVGKLADLAVLSEDYFTVPEERLRRIESVLTIVGGAVVHAAPPFDNLLPKPAG